jgi:small subunit ribosomal protein S8
VSLFCNLISQLKNATRSNKSFILFPKNSLCLTFLKLLFFEGLISSVVELPLSKFLKVKLKYDLRTTSCFRDIKILSSSSKICYLSYSQLTKLEQGMGFFILSTSQGLLTNHECLKRKIGGIAFCYII